MTVGDNLMSRLSSLAHRQREAEAEVERLENELRAAKKNLSQISEIDMPDLMDEAGMEEFTTSDGIKITVGSKIRGSLPPATKPQALKWLETHGHHGLIKRQFVIDFNKDEEERAKEFADQLEAEERPMNYRVDRTVHPSTLKSFVEEQLSEGVEFPMELFGVHQQRFTKVEIR